MSRLKILLGVAISAGLFAYLLASIDLAELAAQLRRTHPGWLCVGTLLAPLALFARAARWRYLFPPRSHPPGLTAAMLIGYMANNVLPLRAGEVVRVYVVSRRWRHGFWTAVATIVVERVLDSLSVVLILAAVVMVVPVPTKIRWLAALLLAVDVVGIGVLTFLAVAPATTRAVLTRVGRRWPAVEHRLLGVHDTFVRGLDGIRTPAHLPPLVFWSIVVWIIPAAAAWTILRASDLALPWIAGWTVLAFVALGVSVPSAPGYVGVFHAAAALAVGLFGVAHAPAVGYAILLHATQFVPVTVMGWIALLREPFSLSEATRRRAPLDEPRTG